MFKVLKKRVFCLAVILVSLLSIANPIFAKERASEWDGTANDTYQVINNNMPYFSESEKKNTSEFEIYGKLDSLGRCTGCFVNVSSKTLPKDEREPSLAGVEPSGWRTNGKSNNNKYSFIDGNYVYNRCHLIGYQHTGQNKNEKNLITGTRFLNIKGMLPFENDVAKYVKKTGNHCLYRVTPIFVGSNLVAEGVRMEAYSVEDGGKGICFNVFCYNVQPNVEINYATGQNWLKEGTEIETYSDPFYDKKKSDSGSSSSSGNSSSSSNKSSSKTTNSGSSSKSSSVSGKSTGGGGFIIIILIIIYLSRRGSRRSYSSGSRTSSKRRRRR